MTNFRSAAMERSSRAKEFRLPSSSRSRRNLFAKAEPLLLGPARGEPGTRRKNSDRRLPTQCRVHRRATNPAPICHDEIGCDQKAARHEKRARVSFAGEGGGRVSRVESRMVGRPI